MLIYLLYAPFSSNRPLYPACCIPCKSRANSLSPGLRSTSCTIANRVRSAPALQRLGTGWLQLAGGEQRFVDYGDRGPHRGNGTVARESSAKSVGSGPQIGR